MAQKFPAKKTAEELKALLKDLEKNHQPGEVSGDVSKTELIGLMKNTIKDLTARGYTVQQIAEAMNKHDSFNILPKSITQILNKDIKNKPKAVRARRKPSAKPSQEPVKPVKNADTQAGTFAIKPDTDDL